MVRLGLAFAIVVVLVVGVGRAAGAQPQKPNVLLICVDDLKPLLGCYGDKTVKSPNIDRLAARGVLFEKAYCNQAVCSPSRNSLMTGIRPQTLGIYDLPTNFRKSAPDAVTVAQLFKNNGYRTEAMGKIFHVGHGNTEDAVSWSVPHWKGGATYAMKESQELVKKAREAAIVAGKTPAQVAIAGKGPPTECAEVPDTAYSDGMIADEAIKRINAAKEKPEQPAFIAVGFIKPHLPFCAPAKYWKLYDRESFKLPAVSKPPVGAPAFAPQSSGELRQYTDIPAVGPVSEAKAKELIHGYHAAVSYMDAQLGRVLDALDASGMAKNTVIVFWGDHGWHLGDHGMWCKHTNYEHAARNPVIISAPGVAKAGVKTSSMMETVDIYPTLCELAGIAPPAGLEGASLVSVLKDPAAPTKESVIHVYPRAQMLGRAIRTARYRLVEWKKPGAATDTAVYELYDYQEDPDETKNLAGERTEVVEKLKAILAKHPEARPQIKAAEGEGAGQPAKKKGNAGKAGKK